MKNLLLSLIVLSATLYCHAGGAADIALPASRLQVQPAVLPQAVAGNQAHTLPSTPQLKLASIGDSRSMLTGNQRADGQTSPDPAARNASADHLPSTPIALACLVLVICILVGRRSADTPID